MESNLAYREELPEEILNGQPVLMSPPASANHTTVSGNLYHFFRNYLEGRLCRAIPDGMAVRLTAEDVFIPDMMVVCDPKKIRWDGVHGAPDLVVEVLSHSTARNDRGYKKTVYERHGVREYWLVSPEGRSVEVYRPESGRLEIFEVYTLRPDYQLADLSEEEKAALPTAVPSILFEDFAMPLEKIFADMV